MEGAEQPDQKRFVPPPGYTQIPNVLLDEVLPIASGAEWKVTCAIARRTFGWGVEERLLTNAELRALTGLSRQSVTDALQAAIARGFIGRRSAGGNKFLYGIRVAAAKKVGSPDGGELPSFCTPDDERGPETRKPSIQGKKDLQGKKELPGVEGTDSAKKVDPVDAVIEECFEAWRTGVGKNGGSKLDARRRSKIRKRLEGAAAESPDQSGTARLAYAREEVLTAVAGMANSDWHRREGHTNFDQLFRDDGCIEKFAKRRRAQLGQGAAPVDQTYATTKKNPELEDAS